MEKVSLETIVDAHNFLYRYPEHMDTVEWYLGYISEWKDSITHLEQPTFHMEHTTGLASAPTLTNTDLDNTIVFLNRVNLTGVEAETLVLLKQIFVNMKTPTVAATGGLEVVEADRPD